MRVMALRTGIQFIPVLDLSKAYDTVLKALLIAKKEKII